jgi:hypothetical protein
MLLSQQNYKIINANHQKLKLIFKKQKFKRFKENLRLLRKGKRRLHKVTQRGETC